MKEALRLMSMPGRLCFSDKGEWIHKLEEDIKVSHPGVALFFSKNLVYSSEHSSYVIQQNSACVKVEIEDCPFILTRFETNDCDWSWVLNSEASQKLLNSERLLIDLQNQLYLETQELAGKQGSTQVKFSRSAAQQVWPLIEKTIHEETGEETFLFKHKDTRIPILPRS